MQNRRIMPPLFKGYPADLKKKDSEERDHTDPMHDSKKAEAQREAAESKNDEKAGKSYTADEVCVAQLLKGHPDAEEIFKAVIGGPSVDPANRRMLAQMPGAYRAPKPGEPGVDDEKAKNPLTNRAVNPSALAALTQKVKSEGDFDLEKGKKKNESGEEFADGSEDTIGSDGHASPGRPGTIKHEGGDDGPDNPGTKTKKASMNNPDLEKAEERGTLTDNDPESFEEGIEEDDTIPAESGKAKKSYTYDEMNVAILLKSSPYAQEILDSIIKAEGVARDAAAAQEHRYNAWRSRSDKRAAKWKSGIEATGRAVQHFKNKADAAEEDAGKSEGEDNDLEKSHDIKRDENDHVIQGDAPRGSDPKPYSDVIRTKGKYEGKNYEYDTKNQTMSVSRFDKPGDKRVLDTTEKYGKELKNASYSLDFSKSILEGLGLLKSKKKNESGEEFQDGSEDTIGSEGEDKDTEKSYTSRVGNASPTKGAAGRHFAREARDDQKKEDAKYRVPRHDSVLGSGGEVTNISDKVIRVRPAKSGTIGDSATIKSLSVELHKSLDDILEKSRRPSWDPKPKATDGDDKEASEPGALSGSGASRDREYERKGELADAWQKKKNSPEFRAASKIKDSDAEPNTFDKNFDGE